jgi:hypothetical protein
METPTDIYPCPQCEGHGVCSEPCGCSNAGIDYSCVRCGNSGVFETNCVDCDGTGLCDWDWWSDGDMPAWAVVQTVDNLNALWRREVRRLKAELAKANR